MPAESKAQQRLFAAALAYKRGELTDASDKVKELAASMSKSELEDFAATPHEGLPDKKASTAQIQGGLLQVPLIKTARNKFMKMYQMGKLSLGGLSRITDEPLNVAYYRDVNSSLNTNLQKRLKTEIHHAFTQPHPKENRGRSNVFDNILREFRSHSKPRGKPELDIYNGGLEDHRPLRISKAVEAPYTENPTHEELGFDTTWATLGGFHQGPQHASRYTPESNTAHIEGFIRNRKAGRPTPKAGYAGTEAHELGHAKQWADPQRAKVEAGILYQRLSPSINSLTYPVQKILSEIGAHWNSTAGNSYGARAARKLPILRASQPQLAKMRKTIPEFDSMSPNLQRRLLAVRSHLLHNYHVY